MVSLTNTVGNEEKKKKEKAFNELSIMREKCRVRTPKETLFFFGHEGGSEYYDV